MAIIKEMKIQNFLLLIGPPGSGKGTQGKLLAPILNYNYLSMGSTLRSFAKLKNPKAKEIKKLIDGGHIISDKLFQPIFYKTMDALPKAEGVILDGFPRDIHQVGVLDDAIKKYHVGKVKAIFLDVPKISVIKRLKERAKEEGRADDDPEAIHVRFEEYHEKTFPLVEYFEKHHWLTRIDGDQSIEKVHADILKKLSHGKISI